MPNKLLITILLLLYSMMGQSLANAQLSSQDLQTDTQAEPQPATKKHISKVTVKDNRLSVEFEDTRFEDIIQTIGVEAKFKVEGKSKVFNTRLTVKFRNMDLDNGIIRLFSLVKESNYIINYDLNGSISRLKILNVRDVTESKALKKLDSSESSKPRGRRVIRPFNPQLTADPSL